jgi:erythromycin esterase
MIARFGRLALLTLFCLACMDGEDQVTDLVADSQVPAAATAWLRTAAVPFTTSDPTANLNDLEPLRQMVGDARVVSLGEATHGTEEFFDMKHRVLRYLVERMGFNAFAIEASWPEANRLDRYVRTGEGDPAVLLAGMYFWTWNTESVMDMIQWMRRHNQAGGNVGFYGFDMQYPGMAFDNVEKLIKLVDPQASSDISARMVCLSGFANNARGTFPTSRYGAQAQPYRDDCKRSLEGVLADLVARKTRYEAASSKEQYARALQSMRITLQFEAFESGRVSRDQSMAENVLWLLDQLGPQSKIVLWAHNYHVSRTPGAMGYHLDTALGKQQVVGGFAFGGGAFTAVTQSGESFQGRNTHRADELVAMSYEHIFSTARMPRFILDLRNRDARAAGTSWIQGPRVRRTIGCCYNPAAYLGYWVSSRLSAEFDLMMYFDQTTATRVLPFQFPTSF